MPLSGGQELSGPVQNAKYSVPGQQHLHGEVNWKLTTETENTASWASFSIASGSGSTCWIACTGYESHLDLVKQATNLFNQAVERKIRHQNETL